MERIARWFWVPILIAVISGPCAASAGSNAGDVPRGDDATKVSAPHDTPKGLARIAVALNGIFRHPDERRVTDPWTLVTVVVTSRAAISKVFVTLNGREVPSTHERRPGGSIVVTAPVMLREGANPLVVSTLEPNGATQREESTLVFDSRAR